MEILGIIIALMILGFAAYRIFLISKSGKIDETSWIEIRILGYDTINDLIKLYNVKEDKDEFIDFVIAEIANKVAESDELTIADKNFWGVDNLTAIFRPIIVLLVNRVISKTSK